MKHCLMLNSPVAQSVPKVMFFNALPVKRIFLSLQRNIREEHGARSQFLLQALFWRTESVL